MAADAPLAASTVAERLCNAATRLAALGALEATAGDGPIPSDTALAAAPALFELLALDVAEVPREVYDRVNLLVARLCAEAVPRGAEAHAQIFGAAWSDGRLVRFLNAEGSVIAVAVRKPAAELTLADAHSYACTDALGGPAHPRGSTGLFTAAGLTTMEYFVTVSPRRAPHRTRASLSL